MTRPLSSQPDGTTVAYARMNGIGNAILVLDCRQGAVVGSETARRIARTPGFGFDQIMALHPPRSAGTDSFVEIYNSDGSLAGACGNGTRCVAWYLLRGTRRDRTVVETAAGFLDCHRLGPERFTVDMGAPAFDWRDIPLRDPVDDTRDVRLDPPVPGAGALGSATMVSMGNPHAVFFLDGSASMPDLAAVGPRLERHPMFPDRANVSFARLVGSDHVRLDVWERGAGLTLACGSAACATAVAAVQRGLTGPRVTIELPGGRLEIEWRAADGHVLMTGDVALEREGQLALDAGSVAA